MSFTSMLAAGFGLSFDSFAAALGHGAGHGRRAVGLALGYAALLGLIFAAVSTLAVLLGWGLGRTAGPLFRELDHWVAFALLAGVGLHMMREAAQPGAGPRIAVHSWLLRTTLIAVATSVDAVIVGISFALLEVDILALAVVVASAHFVLAMAGALLGRQAGPLLGRSANVVGGLVLIALGVAVVIEHMSA